MVFYVSLLQFSNPSIVDNPQGQVTALGQEARTQSDRRVKPHATWTISNDEVQREERATWGNFKRLTDVPTRLPALTLRGLANGSLNITCKRKVNIVIVIYVYIL